MDKMIISIYKIAKRNITPNILKKNIFCFANYKHNDCRIMYIDIERGKTMQQLINFHTDHMEELL